MSKIRLEAVKEYLISSSKIPNTIEFLKSEIEKKSVKASDIKKAYKKYGDTLRIELNEDVKTFIENIPEEKPLKQENKKIEIDKNEKKQSEEKKEEKIKINKNEKIEIIEEEPKKSKNIKSLDIFIIGSLILLTGFFIMK